MENEQQLDYLQVASGCGNHYKWQLSFGQEWLTIDNDHVIETHYCQPGAKGITINTSNGQVFIDFDTLQTTKTGVQVRRLSFLPQGQREEVAWYFRDDSLWREYGSQGSGMLASSVSSRDVEDQYTLSPQGAFVFMVGFTNYSLNFSTMTQTNYITGLSRNVRRRPKFTSSTVSPNSVPSMASSSQHAVGGYKWEFMGNEGEWTEYQAHLCSFDSPAIESQYQLNPQGQLNFNTSYFSYTLDFSRMCQVNNRIGTTRAVRRTFINGSQQSSSLSSTPRWQFLDIGGIWRDYSSSKCTISSQDIELQYQQNPTGTMRFNTPSFTYELNFSAMTQKNLATNTTRRVQRI
nr:uncharacterized protein LOC109959841 [Monopterus albus]